MYSAAITHTYPTVIRPTSLRPSPPSVKIVDEQYEEATVVATVSLGLKAGFVWYGA